MRKCLRILCLGLIAGLALSGCLHTEGIPYGSGRHAFIDKPLSESEWVEDLPIALTLHANFNVSRILVDIVKVPNDPAYHQVLEGEVVEITPGIYQSEIFWTPPDVGRYRLLGYSFTGYRINDMESGTTHTIHLTITEIPEEGRGGEGPRPTPLPTAPAAAPSQAPWVDLWADQYALTSGACTTLRWDAQRVEQLLLNGEAVAFNGSRQICPAADTTYTLHGSSTAGQAESAISISVSAPSAPPEPTSRPPDEPEAPAPPPADTSGPVLGVLQLSTARVFDNAACGDDSITLKIKVQDTGGVARVELHYRARTDSASGAWRVKPMSSGSGGNYSATLANADFISSLAAYTPGRVDVLVKAWDAAGNQSQSAQMSFETDYCLF